MKDIRARRAVASALAMLACELAFVVGSPALAQGVPGALEWNDQTGRLSLDLSESGWRSYPPPGDEEAMIALLLPDRSAEGDAPQEVCALRNPPTPGFEGRPASQAVANEMLRLTVQLDAVNSTPAEVGDQDGVLSAYTAEIVTDHDGRAAHRVRRDFFLAVAGTARMYRFMCVSYRPPEDDAPVRLRALMDRLRISDEQ